MHKFWGGVFGFVIFLAAALFAIAPLAGWWLPRNVSTFGGEVDNLFYLIFWITAFFFLLTEGILIYNIYKFGDPQPNGPKAPYVHGNHKLEVIWTIVPAVILILIAVLQIGTWERIKYARSMPAPDATTLQIVVTARQWEWRIRYPSPAAMRSWEQDPKGAQQWARMVGYGLEDYPQFDDVHDVNEIHCWAQNAQQTNAKVLVHLRTRDVLHSFFLPHLRLKQDAVPGRVIPVWFEVTDYNCAYDDRQRRWVERKVPGTEDPMIWDLACAEFCGARHSMMKGRLFVHRDRADFTRWLEQQQREQDQRSSGAPEVTAAR